MAKPAKKKAVKKKAPIKKKIAAKKKAAPAKKKVVAKKKAAPIKKKAAAKKAAPVTAGGGFRDAFVNVDGFKIRYSAAGNAKGGTVVAIHGGGGMRISGAHEELAKKYRVVAFEIPGMGKSAANEKTQSLPELAKTLLAAATAAGIDRFHLMGVSFGAKVSAWMAIQAPERVLALVQVSPATIRLDRPMPVMRTPEERMALFHAHPERLKKMPKPDPAMDAKNMAFVRRLIGPARDAELEAKLKELPVATLAMFGTKDKITPSEAGRLYKEIIPNCNLMIVYDAAHAMDDDRPEAVSSVIDDFLQRKEQFLVRTQSDVIAP
jgi:pimeloyl-ACP methyl ester carboxylesterase